MSKKSQIKPFLKWVGGKTKLLLDIEKNLPKELKKRKFNYAEPFLGGGAVFFYLVQKFNIEKAYLNGWYAIAFLMHNKDTDNFKKN